MCWHVSAPEKVPTPGEVPTRLGADTCQHMWCQSYELYFDADICRHVSAPEKVLTPGKVPTSADTSWCRHVPTSLILIIWTFLFGCWYVLTSVSTWKGADNWEGADTSRCWHVPTSLILIIWTFLFAHWDVLSCVSKWKGADTWEGADTCWHV